MNGQANGVEYDVNSSYSNAYSDSEPWVINLSLYDDSVFKESWQFYCNEDGSLTRETFSDDT